MKYIHTESVNPYFNLALYEYVMKHLDISEEYLLVFENENSVIVGRHQNTFAEINMDYIEKHNVNVLRRIAGGGAVFQDRGNINFIVVTDRKHQNDFRTFTKPIVKLFHRLGVSAEFSGRNDILINGQKVSGNTQAVHGNRLMHGGTVLFDMDLEKAALALKPSKAKQSKGVSSVRSRVANVRPLLTKDYTRETFKRLLIEHLLGTQDIEAATYRLTAKDYENIASIKHNRYEQWTWNYGRSPRSEYQKQGRYEGGTLEIHFDLVKGCLQNVKFYGDFFALDTLEMLEKHLEHVPYRKKDLREVLSKHPIDRYVLNIKNEDVMDCFFKAKA